MRWNLAVAVVACAALTEAAHGQSALGPTPASPEITASGNGETKISPTSASVSVTVTTRAPTAAQAGADNATRLESTLRALRAVGLAANELNTMGYSVAQDYQITREARTPSGFIARNTISAEVRKLDDIGKVIDAALAGGATEIAGVQYQAANRQEARRAALADAVTQARTDAEVIARAAGGRLGRLIALNSSGDSAPSLYYSDYDFASMAPPPPSTRIAPRDLMVSAQVSGRWEFVPGAAR
ncbi:MAG TPA: SIMPL domain-containing protein [Gemmatimonadaceae bacterium]|nr:SIMPL domain-containing protein [Gemmatimonadaceae bacterium]